MNRIRGMAIMLFLSALPAALAQPSTPEAKRDPFPDVLPSVLKEAPVISREISTVMFGSCLVPQRPHSTLGSAADAEPDLFIFMGDNVYADTTAPSVMERHYRALARRDCGCP